MTKKQIVCAVAAAVAFMTGCSKKMTPVSISAAETTLEGKTELESGLESVKDTQERPGTDSAETQAAIKETAVSRTIKESLASTEASAAKKSAAAEPAAAASESVLSETELSTASLPAVDVEPETEPAAEISEAAAYTEPASTAEISAQPLKLTYGNSKMAFDSLAEADEWAWNFLWDHPEYDEIYKGFSAWTMENGQWTVDFY